MPSELDCRCLGQRALVRPARKACVVYATATATKTVKIGTRGSPLALAQAYLTRDLLKVGRTKPLLSIGSDLEFIRALYIKRYAHLSIALPTARLAVPSLC